MCMSPTGCCPPPPCGLCSYWVCPCWDLCSWRDGSQNCPSLLVSSGLHVIPSLTSGFVFVRNCNTVSSLDGEALYDYVRVYTTLKFQWGHAQLYTLMIPEKPIIMFKLGFFLLIVYFSPLAVQHAEAPPVQRCVMCTNRLHTVLFSMTPLLYRRFLK